MTKSIDQGFLTICAKSFQTSQFLTKTNQGAAKIVEGGEVHSLVDKHRTKEGGILSCSGIFKHEMRVGSWGDVKLTKVVCWVNS